MAIVSSASASLRLQSRAETSRNDRPSCHSERRRHTEARTGEPVILSEAPRARSRRIPSNPPTGAEVAAAGDRRRAATRSWRWVTAPARAPVRKRGAEISTLSYFRGSFDSAFGLAQDDSFRCHFRGSFDSAFGLAQDDSFRCHFRGSFDSLRSFGPSLPQDDNSCVASPPSASREGRGGRLSC